MSQDHSPYHSSDMNDSIENIESVTSPLVPVQNSVGTRIDNKLGTVQMICSDEVFNTQYFELISPLCRNTTLGKFISLPSTKEQLLSQRKCEITFMPPDRLGILLKYVHTRGNIIDDVDNKREKIARELRLCNVSISEALKYTQLENIQSTSDIWVRNCFFGDVDIANVIIKHDLERKGSVAFDAVAQTVGLEVLTKEWKDAAEFLCEHYCGMSVDMALSRLLMYYLAQMKMGEITDFACETIMTFDTIKEHKKDVELAIGKHFHNGGSSTSGIVSMIKFYDINVNLAKAEAISTYYEFGVSGEVLLNLFNDLGNVDWEISIINPKQQKWYLRNDKTEKLLIFLDHCQNTFALHLQKGFDSTTQTMKLFSIKNNNSIPYTSLECKQQLRIGQELDGSFWSHSINGCVFLRLTSPLSISFQNIETQFNDPSGLGDMLFMSLETAQLKDIILFKNSNHF
ncbi:BTB domain-containing protein [Entamoeba marina]